MTATRTVCPRRPRRLSPIRFVLALACAAAFCGIAAAQGGGWAAVEGISPGSWVEVRLSPHGTAKGMLVSVSASGMDIQKSDGSIRRIARPRTTRVYLAGTAHKLRDSLIGAGVGFAGGFAVHFAATQEYEAPGGLLVKNPRVRQSIEFGAFCAAIGTAVGAALGLRRSQTLVYSRESGRGKSDWRSSGQNPSSRADAAHRSPAARQWGGPEMKVAVQ